jgi:hypothetical protein
MKQIPRANTALGMTDGAFFCILEKETLFGFSRLARISDKLPGSAGDYVVQQSSERFFGPTKGVGPQNDTLRGRSS